MNYLFISQDIKQRTNVNLTELSARADHLILISINSDKYFKKLNSLSINWLTKQH